MPDWIDEELATLDLGDDKLHRRQKLLLDRFAADALAGGGSAGPTCVVDVTSVWSGRGSCMGLRPL